MTVEPLRVLMVEDSPSDAKLVLQALRQTNRPIESKRVEDPEAMRAELEHGTWDVIISDWSMPRFSALGALELTKSMGIDLPFIIVSGTIGEEIAVEAMRAGAHDYVLKDKLTRLAPAVEREVRESRIREERRQATRALSASEARYRRIVETTNEGVWLIDAGGKTTFVNARMAQMLGRAADAVIGRSPAEFLAPENLRTFAEYLQGAATAVTSQYEVRLRRADGTYVSTLLEASAVFDGAGKYDGALAMVMDITERIRAEAAQRTSEARFKCLWDAGIILISVSDADGKIIEINDAGLSLLGYTRDELVSGQLTWHHLTPPEWRDADELAGAQLRAGGVASPWQKEVIRKDGHHVPILAAAAVVEASQGIAIALDLTDLKRTEHDLHERMQVAALTADIAMVLTREDPLPRILERCAEALVEHLGVTFARIWTVDADQRHLVLEASSGKTADLAPHQRIPIGQLEVGRLAQQKLPYLTNDIAADSLPGDPSFEGITAFAGQPLLVHDELVGAVAVFSSKPLSDATQTGLGAIADSIALGVQRNRVSQANVRLEAQLRQAQKMEAVGRLAGGIAHDFNNILSVILSCCEFVLTDLEPSDPRREDVHEIAKAGSRAADLTRQLLMFSRQQVLEPRVLDLDRVLEKLEKMLCRILGEDVKLVMKRGTTAGRIRADQGSLEQVIMNLVVNSRDAMPTGGQLTIETADVVLDDDLLHGQPGSSRGPHVRLSVSDTGIGMDPATQLRVFEPFFTTKDVGKGTGLGLSTVFGIVHQSHGFVRVESEPGSGTTFFVYLPKVEDEVESHRKSQVVPTIRGSETILLVEDEDQVRMVARNILKRHGYRVIEMSGPAEALLHCETHPQPIHLLLTDVVMPQMSGPELARRLVLVQPTMKVLCMSGYTDDSIVRHGVLADEIAFLQKPFTTDTLNRKVREVLDAPMPPRRVP